MTAAAHSSPTTEIEGSTESQDWGRWVQLREEAYKAHIHIIPGWSHTVIGPLEPLKFLKENPLRFLKEKFTNVSLNLPPFYTSPLLSSVLADLESS